MRQLLQRKDRKTAIRKYFEIIIRYRKSCPVLHKYLPQNTQESDTFVPLTASDCLSMKQIISVLQKVRRTQHVLIQLIFS